jgi:phosphate uptake regulator
VTGLKTTSDCLSYRIHVKSIEQIGDHAFGIAENVWNLMKDLLALELASTISKISELSLSVFRDSLELPLQRNYKLAAKKVGRLHYLYPLDEDPIARLQKSKEVRYHSGSIRLFLGNIGRIAEYASDIAETAINETISEIIESKKGGGDQTYE